MMRRYASVLVAIAAVGVVLPFFVGVGPTAILFLVPLFGLLGGVALLAARRTALPERGWSGPASNIDLGTTAVAAGPDPAVRPPAREVAAALARVEARELATSPWFGVGIGFLVVSLLAFGVVWGADNGEHWSDIVGMAPWLAHPLVGMVVLAAHRGVTRARRDGADELFDTCPAAPTTRTWGAIGSAWVPVAALVVFFAVYGGMIALKSPNLYGSPGAGAVARVLSAVVLGAGGVVLGVALGRWVRFALAPIVAVVVVGFLSLELATYGDPGWNRLQQLATFPPISSLPPVLRDDADWSHLAWVVALTAGVLVIAVARHHRDRAVAVAGLAAGLLVAATGVAATRPMPASSAARIASLIADPASHQVCHPAGSVQVCVYPGHEELAARVVAEVRPVAAMLPDAAGPLTLRHRFPGRLDDLPPEVARRLPAGVPPVPADEAALGFKASRQSLLETRLVVAAHVTGLPPEAGPDRRPLVIAGQARGVVALWLATRGLGPGPTRRLTSGRAISDVGNGEPDAFDRGYAWPGCLSPVVWSAQDLLAARALIALPESTVGEAVHQGWAQWRDPSTGTDELLAAVGLPPAGPFELVAARTEGPNC